MVVSDIRGPQDHQDETWKRQVDAVFQDARDLIHAALVSQFHLDDAAATKFETDLYVWFSRFCMRSHDRSRQELRSVLLAACWEFARRYQQHGTTLKKEAGARPKAGRHSGGRIESRSSAGLRKAASNQIAASSRELTERELQIVEGMSRGFRTKEIGRRLRISEKTVKTSIDCIFRKLRVNDGFVAGLYDSDRTRSGS